MKLLLPRIQELLVDTARSVSREWYKWFRGVQAHIDDTDDPHNVTWAQVDKTTSSIADITTKSHTALTDKGTNTHAQIDTFITNAPSTYAPIAKGVTNGDTHDHSGGDGAQIDHVNLASKGTNTHAQIDTHLGASAPHSGHEQTANKNAANGYAGLDAGTKLAGTQVPYGTSANTACQGNDARLSDARSPTAHATSHKHSGSDEVATATPAANAIPKSGAGSTLAAGWIPDLSGTYAVAAKGVTNGDTHDHNGGDGAQIDHANLANKGTNTHGAIDSFIASKASASGLASLDGSSKVVQNPASASTSGGASTIPLADASGYVQVTRIGAGVSPAQAGHIRGTLRLDQDTGTYWTLESNSAGALDYGLLFKKGATEYLRMANASGASGSTYFSNTNVGIGKTPSVPLDVNGQINGTAANISGLTASRGVLTDGSKNLVSANAPVSVVLGSDVVLVNTTVYTILDTTLSAGTWLVVGQAFVTTTSASVTVAIELWDAGSTVWSTSEKYMDDASETISIPFSSIFTLGSSTTVRLSAKANAGSSTFTVKAATTQFGSSNTATQMSCVRVA